MKPHYLLLGTTALVAALSVLAPVKASAQPDQQWQCELWLRNKPPIEPEYICISQGSGRERKVALAVEEPVKPASTDNGGPVIEPDDGDGHGHHHHHKPHWPHWMKDIVAHPPHHPHDDADSEPHGTPHGDPKQGSSPSPWHADRALPDMPGMADAMKVQDAP